MLRKTTAMMFMLVMALLITLKHPVLGYCLCLDSYFTGDCVCQFEKNQSAQGSVTDAPRPSCCANCEKDKETDGDQDSPEEPAPCDDCTEHLNIDVGDFVWQSSDEVPSDSDLSVDCSYSLNGQEIKIFSAVSCSSISVRAGPPPGLHNTGLPIYLRHSVLRL